MSVALAQGSSFSFAWVSDTHLYPKTLNTRFVEKAVRAFKEVQDMSSKLDFMIFGGDLAQLGDPVEIKLGADLLKEVKIKKYFIPGEHDWYLDMGAHVEEELRVVAMEVRPQRRALHRPRHGRQRARLLDRRRR